MELENVFQKKETKIFNYLLQFQRVQTHCKLNVFQEKSNRSIEQASKNVAVMANASAKCVSLFIPCGACFANALNGIWNAQCAYLRCLQEMDWCGL